MDRCVTSCRAPSTAAWIIDIHSVRTRWRGSLLFARSVRRIFYCGPEIVECTSQQISAFRSKILEDLPRRWLLAVMSLDFICAANCEDRFIIKWDK